MTGPEHPSPQVSTSATLLKATGVAVGSRPHSTVHLADPRVSPPPSLPPGSTLFPWLMGTPLSCLAPVPACSFLDFGGPSSSVQHLTVATLAQAGPPSPVSVASRLQAPWLGSWTCPCTPLTCVPTAPSHSVGSPVPQPTLPQCPLRKQPHPHRARDKVLSLTPRPSGTGTFDAG